MDDNIRTCVMDYLEDFCNIPADKTEDLAEDLDNYLDERGFKIIDAIHFRNIFGKFIEKLS